MRKYVVVKFSCGKITDVWTKISVLPASPKENIGIKKIELSYGNSVDISGDYTLLRFDTDNEDQKKEYEKYFEYHLALDGISYKKRFAERNRTSPK